MEQYNFRKYQHLCLRLWHWLTGLLIFGLMGTGFLRMTFLSGYKNSKLIESKMQEAGTSITPELARDIASAIRNPMWDWHIYFGFSLAIFFIGRILIAIFIEKRCPGRHALRSFLGLSKVPPQNRPEARQYALAKVGQALFYFATLLMVISGVLMYFKDNLGLSKGFLAPIKETHELMIWFFAFFVVSHVMGVVRAENGKYPGLVSDMINGGDPKLK